MTTTLQLNTTKKAELSSIEKRCNTILNALHLVMRTAPNGTATIRPLTIDTREYTQDDKIPYTLRHYYTTKKHAFTMFPYYNC